MSISQFEKHHQRFEPLKSRKINLASGQNGLEAVIRAGQEATQDITNVFLDGILLILSYMSAKRT